MITKGQKISDRYEIIKSIGEGGMANVYLAYDILLKRNVAIKVLRGDLSQDEKFIRRFQREAISSSSLSHPNIVEMYDVGEDNGTYYIVMEYVEGKTLKQLLKRRGTLTITEVIDIMLQLTDGISCAHESYIIHRDLKPQNIMIKDDGRIKITDFGIAMALNSTQLTQTNSVMGSVHYLPPEQASGKGSTIKSDIYSMGIMFFELLTGKLPFKGDNAVEIALKHMKDEIPSVRKINPEIPQSIENIILKATAKNPKNRYDDVREMYNDIKTCMDEGRKNEAKYKYKYPEHEQDEKDVIKVGESDSKVAKKVEDDKKNKVPTVIIGILSFVFIAGLISLGIILYPTFSSSNNVKIPDVTNLSVEQAEKALTNLGFAVSNETQKEFNSSVSEGMVIGTEPSIGRARPKGTTITIIESLGKNDTYKIEDYTGKNYIEVQTTLEKVYNMEVKIEKKDVEIKDGMDTQLIVGQSLEVGTVVNISSDNRPKITLYIPDYYDQYPDFVKEGWSLDEIKDFASKYNLDLKVLTLQTNEYKEGTILKQSRTGKIINGASLYITIAEKEEIEEKEEKEEKETKEEKPNE